MTREIRIKRRQTLLLNLTFLDENDAPIDLSAATVTAQVRDTLGDLVGALPVTVTSTPGFATIAFADTANWPLGTLRSDLHLVAAGTSDFSETFGIHVDRAVTEI